MWDSAEDMFRDLGEQLTHIARQVRDLNRNPRVERGDILQEARIGAWQGMERGCRKGLRGDSLRKYVLGAARSEANRYVGRMRRGPIFSAENWGLIGTLGGSADAE